MHHAFVTIRNAIIINFHGNEPAERRNSDILKPVSVSNSKRKNFLRGRTASGGTNKSNVDVFSRRAKYLSPRQAASRKFEKKRSRNDGKGESRTRTCPRIVYVNRNTRGIAYVVVARVNCPKPSGVVAGARFRFPVSPPEEPRDPGSPSASPLLPRALHSRGFCRPAGIKGTLFFIISICGGKADTVKNFGAATYSFIFVLLIAHICIPQLRAGGFDFMIQVSQVDVNESLSICKSKSITV